MFDAHKDPRELDRSSVYSGQGRQESLECRFDINVNGPSVDEEGPFTLNQANENACHIAHN